MTVKIELVAKSGMPAASMQVKIGVMGWLDSR